MSPKLDTPTIKEAKTSGTAIILSAVMKNRSYWFDIVIDKVW
ncbi:hypothetical protein ADIWIN_3318 [Winogradskyella psychrotolerans RS-3]|uniref:Uncharacterized protein n=1 Tax=Winogradskyella psychrotolerans RS-3 TaxID=641526 RepID=S7VL37_9FLAO|nr:hypothetical protein ADIWIN_3318 [Winogradskyella psychrotolerans RS-3]